MAGESSAEARAKADAYAKQRAAQTRIQNLNEKIGAPIAKVGTKSQVIKGSGGVVKPLKSTSTTSTTSVSATEAYDYDPSAFIHDAFNGKGGKGIQNPPFIFPGLYDRPVDPKESKIINRGYIRRLTEFYDKQTAGQPGTVALDKSTVSTVTNMRCNFQFNPDNITRMVTAESDMTFFFNQDPSQLAQPVPGKAGFAFELLFNREAEVTNKVYLTKDSKPVKVVVDDLDPVGNAASWIGKPHDPAWVAKIGVLADILILDDVIGQGLAKDILDKINDPQALGPNGTKWGFDATNSPNSPTTSTSSGSTTTKAIDGKRYDAYSMNMGNKAYLTPTPVRIMFTKWMMVEGFVQSVQVTFNKFSRNMIPTQATVMVQMQALYMGFAQQKTFLTDLPGIELGQQVSPGNTIPAPGSIDLVAYEQIDNLLNKKSFFDSQDSINYNLRRVSSPPYLPLTDLFRLAGTDVDFATDKNTGINKNGDEILKQLKDDKVNYEITWDGVLKLYWHSHAVSSTGAELGGRGTYPADVSNTVGGPIITNYTYKSGPPPNATNPNTDYKLWGTPTAPMIFTSVGNIAKPDMHGFGWDYQIGSPDRMWLGETDVPGNGQEAVQPHTWSLRNREQYAEELKRIGGQLKTPFKQDKFTYELGIRWNIKDLDRNVDVWFYDWHYHSDSVTIDSPYPYAGTSQKEWFQAKLKGMDYRVKGTPGGGNVSGNGVTWFENVKKYLGGNL